MRFPVILYLLLILARSSLADGAGASIKTNQLVFDSDRTGNHEIFAMNDDGTGVQQLTSDLNYENWWPRISPDRTKILFYRAPSGFPEDYSQASLWVMNCDGSSLTLLRPKGKDGWTMQGHAEWSPDGKRIAMFGSVAAALEIFVADSNGQNAVQFTSRGGLNTDVSWAPDGAKLLFNGRSSANASESEIYVMQATALSPSTRLTNDNLADFDPYFSPDGTKIAWLVNVDPSKFEISPGVFLGAWAIRIANADGSNASYLINDGNVNSKPAWSPDGTAIFFHRMELAPQIVETKFGVFRISADKTRLTRLTAINTGNNEFPSGLPVAPPQITGQPPSLTSVGGGGHFTLSVAVAGLNLAFQWEKEGVPLNGATNSSYAVTNMSIQASGTYRVVVSNLAGSVTSDDAVVEMAASSSSGSSSSSSSSSSSGSSSSSSSGSGTPSSSGGGGAPSGAFIGGVLFVAAARLVVLINKSRQQVTSNLEVPLRGVCARNMATNSARSEPVRQSDF